LCSSESIKEEHCTIFWNGFDNAEKPKQGVGIASVELTIAANVATATGPSLLGGPGVLRVKFVFRI